VSCVTENRDTRVRSEKDERAPACLRQHSILDPKVMPGTKMRGSFQACQLKHL
jgi:hypothetical protein